jgi:hypothetical protein
MHDLLFIFPTRFGTEHDHTDGVHDPDMVARSDDEVEVIAYVMTQNTPSLF